jgi:polysaccharide export outer membrane protein
MKLIRRRFSFSWTIPGFILCLSVPISANAQQAPGSKANSDLASTSSGVTAPNYRLAANDLVYIKVFEEDDLNSTLRITEDGAIIFPLLGVVKVGGQTVQAATRTIRDLLDARYLVNPQVSLTVLGYANRNITVLGQVQHPGAFSLKDQGSIDLLRAIGLAGGFTRMASPSRVTVKRTVEGREVVCVLDAKRMAADSNAGPFIVLPGDTITVAERIF